MTRRTDKPALDDEYVVTDEFADPGYYECKSLKLSSSYLRDIPAGALVALDAQGDVIPYGYVPPPSRWARVFRWFLLAAATFAVVYPWWLGVAYLFGVL